MIKSEAFLALEASLATRLSGTLKKVTKAPFQAAKVALDSKDWATAVQAVHGINLTPVFDLNKDYILYLSKIALLFGASRVTNRPGTSAVGLGFATPTIEAMVSSFKLSIQYNLQEAIIQAALQLIAKARDRENPDYKSTESSGSYLAKVFKAGGKAILPFDSFMDATGNSFLNIASSLHTSRLSALGYVSEAEYMGVSVYQINEQLDGRTCPICAVTHGKQFKVSDARNLLDIVVRTQDPDELKNLQAWPKQDKASVDSFSSMTADELVTNGWHIPPFHPRCRGLLSKAGRVPALTAGKTAPPTPEKYVSTKDDFLQLGIKLSPAKIDLWNKLLETSPSEVIASLTGTTQDQLLAGLLGKQNPQDILGLSNLSVTSTGVNLELQTPAFGSKHPIRQDYYFKKDQSLYVGSIEVHEDDAALLPKVLKNLYGVSKETAMKSMQIIADDAISGYTWPKYGFSMSPKQWGLVKAQIARSKSKMALLEASSGLEQKAAYAILDSADPKDVFALSDLPNLGEPLLDSTTWVGDLDFLDPESVVRFLSSVGAA